MLMFSAAMAKPDEALLLEWTRDGQVQEASVLPEVGPRGLLSLGIVPVASATLRSDLDDVMSQKGPQLDLPLFLPDRFFDPSGR